MDNINPTLSCFQPTYEELKPCSKSRQRKLCVRFQPTYEELKLVKRLEAGSIDSRFQPTYEELKHNAPAEE